MKLWKDYKIIFNRYNKILFCHLLYSLISGKIDHRNEKQN